MDGPLNTYQDFKNVFNAKNVGSKSSRRGNSQSNGAQKIDYEERLRLE